MCLPSSRRRGSGACSRLLQPGGIGVRERALVSFALRFDYAFAHDYVTSRRRTDLRLHSRRRVPGHRLPGGAVHLHEVGQISSCHLRGRRHLMGSVRPYQATQFVGGTVRGERPPTSMPGSSWTARCWCLHLRAKPQWPLDGQGHTLCTIAGAEVGLPYIVGVREHVLVSPHPP